MSNVIEVKAMSKEQAVARALKIMEASSENVIKIVEKQKSRSFFGFFNKEGIYEIEIDKNYKKSSEIEKEGKKVEKLPKDILVQNTKNSDFVEKKSQFKEKENKVEDSKKVDAVNLIKKKTEELLEKTGLTLRVEVTKINEKNYYVGLFGEDNGIIIGKKGKTLNSFEYLLNSMLKDYRIEVDVEGFKEKRLDTVRELGKKMAEKVIKTGKTVRLNPMPPRERKAIHEIVNKYSELDTFSEGRDPKRYIVIKKKK